MLLPLTCTVASSGWWVMHRTRVSKPPLAAIFLRTISECAARKYTSQLPFCETLLLQRVVRWMTCGLAGKEVRLNTQ